LRASTEQFSSKIERKARRAGAGKDKLFLRARICHWLGRAAAESDMVRSDSEGAETDKLDIYGASRYGRVFDNAQVDH
jgi:hypothetical protein